MQDTKITKERVQNHFTYSWWKYALLAAIAVFGWNLFYTATAYRAPKDKRLDIYFVTHALSAEATELVSAQVLEHFPELEDSTCASIVYTKEDNYYGAIQLTTYMGAGEGDVYLMTKERFDALKESGGFEPLDAAIASGELDLRGIDTSRGIATDESGVTALFGVPADTLYGFMDAYGVDNRDLVICVMAYSHNKGTAIRYVDWLVKTMRAEKPEWVKEQEAKTLGSESAQQADEISSY